MYNLKKPDKKRFFLFKNDNDEGTYTYLLITPRKKESLPKH